MKVIINFRTLLIISAFILISFLLIRLRWSKIYFVLKSYVFKIKWLYSITINVILPSHHTRWKKCFFWNHNFKHLFKSLCTICLCTNGSCTYVIVYMHLFYYNDVVRGKGGITIPNPCGVSNIVSVLQTCILWVQFCYFYENYSRELE